MRELRANVTGLCCQLKLENKTRLGPTARFWPSILTPFNQSQNIESCATTRCSLFEFKQTFDLPKGLDIIFIRIIAQFFLSSGTSMGILCENLVEQIGGRNRALFLIP